MPYLRRYKLRIIFGLFGVLLMAYRDADLTVHKSRPPPKMVHHDMDAPPWWHFKRKKMIYIDGFAEKGHRGLMQFMLVPQNGPEKFREWEADVGVGLDAGEIGAYLAKSLTKGEPVRFLVRLQRRF